MAATTKSGGRYFYENERVWEEARQSGFAPFYVGNWGGRIPAPQDPTKDFLKEVCEGGKHLGRVQKNRVGAFDLTFTFSKSVSIVLFGLTPQARWAQESSKLLVDATRPEVERLVSTQRANAGPQGKSKVDSRGGAVGFVHWESSRKVVHGHVHYCVPNLTSPRKGKAKSIANAHVMFAEQGLMRARSNKRLDDMLQDRGFVTKREGKAVAIAGIPDKMVARLSPSRRAMGLAMKKMGFTSPRAQAFYARHAKRGAGPRTLGDPAQFRATCRKLARKHGVTVDSLKRPAGAPAPHRDKYAAASVAYDVALEARDSLSKKHGTFTAEQFRERVYTRGIGKATTLDALETFAGAALGNEKVMGIKKQVRPDGSVHYAGPESQKTQKQAAGQYRAATGEAWEDLKRAARGLGEAVLARTTQEVSKVITRLAEAVNPPPKTLVIDAAKLEQLIATHRPISRPVAHAKAFLAALSARGNPHDRAYVAEGVYRSLRTHARLPKNAVVVVERGSMASARELHLLAKIARRDGASVVLADQGRGGPRHGHGNSNDHHQQRNRTP